MFEALFILTTLDAGTRVGRYLIQDVLGNVWKPLGETKRLGSNVLASALMVGGWGYFLIQGVRDPLGGINSLWPLFGIANQMLAGIALCLATTILLKMELGKVSSVKCQVPSSEFRVPSSKFQGRPLLALITLVPLVWLLAVTMTAGAQKIWHSDARIGFLAQARALKEKQPELERMLLAAKAGGEIKAMAEAQKAWRANRLLRFNNLLDAAVAGVFLILVTAVVLLSVREWILLLARRKLAVLRETEPVWLPDYAIAESNALNATALLALGLGLLKEFSGEAHLQRAREAQACCQQDGPSGGNGNKLDPKIYVE